MRLLRGLGIGASMAGYGLTAFLLWYAFREFGWSVPGNDALVWDRVGDEIRAGRSPYYDVPGGGGFYYAPPWAVAFAALSWLPPVILAWLLIAAECAALWYIAGSWLRLGWCLLLPLVAFELPSSQVNLILAAGIAAALRGDPRLAVIGGAAKFSPLLAIDLRQWRVAFYGGAVLVALTVPWIGLWPEWLAQLIRNDGNQNAPSQLLVPFLPRLAVAVGLVATRRPFARGVAAVIAIPAPYWVTSVLLLGLLPPKSRS